MGIWGGLWSVPELSGEPDKKAIRAFYRKHYQGVLPEYRLLASFRHTFSHYHLDIFPIVIEVKQAQAKVMEGAQQIWYNPRQPDPVGLPKPIQSIVRLFV